MLFNQFSHGQRENSVKLNLTTHLIILRTSGAAEAAAEAAACHKVRKEGERHENSRMAIASQLPYIMASQLSRRKVQILHREKFPWKNWDKAG